MSGMSNILSVLSDLFIYLLDKHSSERLNALHVAVRVN